MSHSAENAKRATVKIARIEIDQIDSNAPTVSVAAEHQN